MLGKESGTLSTAHTAEGISGVHCVGIGIGIWHCWRLEPHIKIMVLMVSQVMPHGMTSHTYGMTTQSRVRA